MNLHRELVVDASSSDVWAFLWDVERLSRCIPGCSDVRTLAHQRSYSAVIEQRVGPFRVTFPLSIEVTKIEAASAEKAISSKGDVVDWLKQSLDPSGRRARA